MSHVIGISRCAHCAFFSKLDPPDARIPSAGECRFNPPGMFPIPIQTVAGPSLTAGSFFPPVDGERHWCGKYRDRAAVN